MTRAEILQAIQGVGADTFGCPPEELQEHTVASDVAKWDSLRHLIFISEVERVFAVEFDVDAISTLTNVADLIGMIDRLL
jgi:acyl carrier protein